MNNAPASSAAAMDPAANILIVDDEIENIRLLELLLRTEGYVTQAAANGEKALASIARQAPDLVLLDVMMPGMDGYAVARLLKANPTTSSIPIILITAQTDRSARLAGLQAGAEDFLSKPVDRDELWLRVRNLLRLKTLSDALHKHNQRLEQEVQQRVADLHRFRSAMDASADGIFFVQRSSMRFVDVNAAACHLLGYTREELLQRGPAHLTGAAPEKLAQEHDEIIAGRAANQLTEAQLRRKDGSEFFAEVRRHPHRDGADWIVVGVVRDITERRAQQAQRILSAQVFAQSREGITVTDAAGNTIMVNQAFTDITGYTEAEVLGRNPRMLRSGRHDTAFYQSLWNDLMREGHWAGEIWNRKKDGTLYPEWLTISALRDGQNHTTNYVASFSDLSSSKAAENRIQWLSHFDVLTGLPNRTLLQDRSALTISMVQRADEPLTMMLVSINHFSSINDTLGHHMSDELLIEVAKRLSESVRDQDTVARVAGKEFVLVIPGTTAIGAAHLASKLLARLAQPCRLGAHDVAVSASIGIAVFPDNGGDFDALFKAVEIAMHRCPQQERGSYQFYSTEMYEQIVANDTLANALRQAIAQDQLQLVYQPQVDLQTGRISGMEALLRWQHPELGAVSQVQFIPLAEASGLIIDIGEWVLRRACQDIRHWLDQGIAVGHVAVNASPLQFGDNDFVAQVRRALVEAHIDPELICIEVTENALMDDVPRNEAMLHALKELGLKLSLDDFGTGYSSLSYLKRFPFDQVKIDQSFVRDLATSQSDRMLVKVIVSMAHGLGMKVIAEGVETEAQCDIVRTSLCDEIQGYFFSRPVSAQAIQELLSEARQLPAHLLRLQ